MLVLYNPQSSAQRKPVLPASLFALGALLEREHDYLIIDGNLEPDPVAAIDAAVRDEAADLLAVTVMPGPQLETAAAHCRELKSRHPGLTVVWGGYFPTQHYEACLNSPYVDYVVRGHGEVVFKALVDRLGRSEDPRGLAGLAYRDSATGAVRSNPPASIPHPEALPDFPYHRVEMTRYLRPTFLGTRTLSHHSSYGCPFFCNFCAVVNMVEGRWLPQSAEQSARAARTLAGFGANAVEFNDNNFFVRESRTAEFAERIMPLGISWWGESRIDTLLNYSTPTWQLLERSGLRMVFMGAESGSDETLKRMNKGGTATTAKTLAIAEKMAHYAIVPEFSFVIGNPPDPEADVLQTLEFVRRVKEVNPASEIILYLYTPVPLSGSLYDEAQAQGFRFPQTLDEWLSPAWRDFSRRRIVDVPWLKDPLRRKIWDFEHVLNAYYPTTTDHKLHRLWRVVLRALSAWRYHLRFYRHPLELRAFHRLLSYQRPETTGF